MNTGHQTIRALSMVSAVTFFIGFGWTMPMAASTEGLKVNLSGDQEVPPVNLGICNWNHYCLAR